MCWKSKHTPIKKVAEKDITVYKIFGKYGGKIHSCCYYGFLWGIGEVKTLDKPLQVEERKTAHPPFNDITNYNYVINEGYHSFAIKPYCNYVGWMNPKSVQFIFHWSSDDMLCECIIPEGSIYYENEYGEIVSDKLMITNETDYENVKGLKNLNK